MPKEEKTVDIDTTGPGAEVNVEEKKENEEVEVVEPVKEEPVEEKKEEVEEKQEASDEKPVEEKKELEEYSEGVQRRISKLTKKWREAERQKEAALDYAKGVQYEHSQLKTKFSKLEPNYVKALENRVTAGMEAAKAKLVKARDGGDIDSEVDAQKSIAQLGIEEVRLNALKDRQSQDKEREVRTPSLQDAVGRTPPPDPKAEAWAEKNAWFGKDNAMTYTAFDYHKKLTEDELVEMVRDFNVIIAGTEPITKKVMDAATNLKMISRVGIGLDSVDLLEAKEKGIIVCNVPDYGTNDVADHTRMVYPPTYLVHP